MALMIYMFVLHFVADFICQSREMGQKKSTHLEWLAKHLLIQFAFFAIGLMYPLGWIAAIKFATFNTLIHGIIDWNIWRGYKSFTFLRLHKQAKESTWMNGNLNIPHEDRAFDKFNELAKDFKYWEDHWFYTTIGFDQLLHASTIIVLYGWLV